MGVDEAGLSDHVVDAVLPQQMGDAAHHPVDDAAAALDGLGVVDGEVIEGHAELPGAVEEAHDLRVAQNRLEADDGSMQFPS